MQGYCTIIFCKMHEMATITNNVKCNNNIDHTKECLKNVNENIQLEYEEKQIKRQGRHLVFTSFNEHIGQRAICIISKLLFAQSSIHILSSSRNISGGSRRNYETKTNHWASKAYI